MNYTKESSTIETLTRAEFTARVSAIIKAIATPKINAGEAYRILKEQFGMSGALNFSPHWGDDTEKWEHPLITQHNAKCGSRGILNAHFFTLYSKVVEYRVTDGCHADYNQGYIEFTTGRVGNTYSVGQTFNVIEDAPVQPDDSQGTLNWESVDA